MGICMAFFVLHSDITVGGFRFSGVQNVVVRRSMNGLSSSAHITLPGKARVDQAIAGRDAEGFVNTGSLLKEGDRVTINLGYNDDLRTEFEGYVKRVGTEVPLVVECEGYERELRLVVNINRYYQATTAKDLLTDMCSQTSINVICDVDFPLRGIRLVNADGIDVINHIKKCSEGALSIFFIAPSTLWCGLVYTPYLDGKGVLDLPTVAYDLGYNCPRDNGLQRRVPAEKVQVFMNGVLVSGDGVRTESKDKEAKRKVRFFTNNVPSESVLQACANEIANRRNYTGYTGSLTGFLQPYCMPGYVASVSDVWHPELKGDYLVEDVEVTFGVNGARRRVSLGVKLNGGQNS